MNPGWYSKTQNQESAAYFDGESWGPPTEVTSLDPDIRGSISVLPSTPPPPPVVAGVSETEGEPPREGKGGTGWWWGVAAGTVLIVVGIVFGFQPAGSYCGAPFKASNMAEYMDAYAPSYGYSSDYSSECREDMVGATTTTWVLIGLGVLVTLASALIMATIRSGRARTAAGPSTSVQTMASRIEDLARLRDKGLVSPEEYEWKRQELLRG